MIPFLNFLLVGVTLDRKAGIPTMIIMHRSVNVECFSSEFPGKSTPTYAEMWGRLGDESTHFMQSVTIHKFMKTNAGHPKYHI